MKQAGAGVLVVGAGDWGRNLIRNFHDLGDLAGICEVNDKLLEEAQATYPEIPTWDSLDEALAFRAERGTSPAFEAVAIATPVVTHYALARQVLEAGLPVFIEKPMALTSAESGHLLELSRRRGRMVMVGHLPLFMPAIEELKATLAAGALGDLLYLQARRVNLGKVRRHENVLWSLAPHDVAVFLYLLGEMPTQVFCSGGAWLQPGVEDVAFLELRFADGKVAAAWFSWLDPATERKLSVVGRKGMAVVDELNPHARLRLTDRRWDPEKGITIAGTDRFPLLASEQPLARECRHFLQSLRTGKRPRSGAALGHRVVRVLEKATESLRDGGAWKVLEEDPLDRRLGTVASGR